MAAYTNVNVSKHATLSGTAADSVAFTAGINVKRVEVLNRSGTADLDVVVSRTAAAPTTDADGNVKIPAGGYVEIDCPGEGTVVNVLGNGNAFSVARLEVRS